MLAMGRLEVKAALGWGRHGPEKSASQLCPGGPLRRPRIEAAAGSLPWYTPGVLSEEQVRLYRRMSVQERWALTEELMTVTWRALLELPFEERERRLRLAREEHEAGNQALAQALLSRS